MLTELELKHIETHFPDINPDEVQSRLGMGIEKVAFAMQNVASGVRQRVLKLLRKDTQEDAISQWVSPRFTATADQVKRDNETCVKYFGEAVVVPDIVRSKRGETYCLLQDKLEMEMLTPALLLQHPHLVDELKHMIEQDRKLQSEKSRFFDFQGWDIWRLIYNQIAMGNVAVVYEQKGDEVKARLKIFDLTLMHTPGFSVAGIAHAGGYLSNWRNNVRMVDAADKITAV